MEIFNGFSVLYDSINKNEYSVLICPKRFFSSFQFMQMNCHIFMNVNSHKCFQVKSYSVRNPLQKSFWQLKKLVKAIDKCTELVLPIQLNTLKYPQAHIHVCPWIYQEPHLKISTGMELFFLFSPKWKCKQIEVRILKWLSSMGCGRLVKSYRWIFWIYINAIRKEKHHRLKCNGVWVQWNPFAHHFIITERIQITLNALV